MNMTMIPNQLAHLVQIVQKGGPYTSKGFDYDNVRHLRIELRGG